MREYIYTHTVDMSGASVDCDVGRTVLGRGSAPAGKIALLAAMAGSYQDHFGRLVPLPARNQAVSSSNPKLSWWSPDCVLLRFEDCMFAPQSCKCYGYLSSQEE